MIDTGVSVAWLMEPSTRAMFAVNRTWGWIRSTPEWSSWLAANVPADLFVLVNFEDRPTRRTLVRRDSLTGYVPATFVQAAVETNNLPELAGEVYRDLYVAWANKQNLPAPPPVPNLTKIPSRFP